MNEAYTLFFLGAVGSGIVAVAGGIAVAFKILFKQMVEIEHRLTKIETFLRAGDTETIKKIRAA